MSVVKNLGMHAGIQVAVAGVFSNSRDFVRARGEVPGGICPGVF